MTLWYVPMFWWAAWQWFKISAVLVLLLEITLFLSGPQTIHSTGREFAFYWPLAVPGVLFLAGWVRSFVWRLRRR